jgi:ATP-dependent RNA helicase DeaD
MSFKELGLKPELIKAVEYLGFDDPMPIQEKTIPVLLSEKRDFVGLAQTGTGKTAAFGLPMIQQIHPKKTHPQGIILCPTRELCMQITEDLKNYSRFTDGIRIVAIYGGASMANQIRQIQNGAQIVVATPGRLVDLMERKSISLSKIQYAVLDEADEMLHMGFQEDINKILGQMPAKRNIWLFSATMPPGVAAIAKNYLKDPVEVSVGGRNRGPEQITHTCYVIHEKDRYQGLKRIIDFSPDMFGLVFCRTRKETQSLAESLMGDGYQADALHGDLSQPQRDYIMRKFRQKAVRILVATDVAARGLDVDDITHVIHYNLPDEAEVYTHRSGRTGRAGKSGVSMLLANQKQLHRVRELEKKRNIRFAFDKMPAGKEICQKQLHGLVDKIVNADINAKEMKAYLPEVVHALEQFSKEELIQRVIAVEFNRLIEYYRRAGEIHMDAGEKKEKKFRPEKSKDRDSIQKTQRFQINVGRMDKINEGAVLRLICEQAGIRSNMIGRIDLNQKYSFFEVDIRAAAKVQQSIRNAMLDGRIVDVRAVDEKKNHREKGGPLKNPSARRDFPRRVKRSKGDFLRDYKKEQRV